jgi:hypothetical protein
MNDGRFGVSLLRQTAGGSTSTFPGSDQLIMARRTG